MVRAFESLAAHDVHARQYRTGCARTASLPPPEGGGLDPVLAPGRAEPAAGVLGDVEEDAIAARRIANAEAIAVTGSEHPGQGLGADRSPHRDQSDVQGVMVQPPPPALLGQVRVGGMPREEGVQAGRGGGEPAVVQVAKDLT